MAKLTIKVKKRPYTLYLMFVLFSLIFLIILAITSPWKYFQKSQQTASVEYKPDSLTAQWNYYNNMNKYAVFKYPKDWNIKEYLINENNTGYLWVSFTSINYNSCFSNTDFLAHQKCKYISVAIYNSKFGNLGAYDSIGEMPFNKYQTVDGSVVDIRGKNKLVDNKFGYFDTTITNFVWHNQNVKDTGYKVYVKVNGFYITFSSSDESLLNQFLSTVKFS